MGNLLKKSIGALAVLLTLVAACIAASALSHLNKLTDEAQLFHPLGQMVEVGGHQISIYIEGSGDQTLVFMSGGGTSSPILDFKTLYSELTDQYRVVVIEKLGYGFSDITDERRNIDAILEESRAALSQAEINGPYVLIPHSMSGIEALRWAQQYPDEVRAIVGLDMSVPESYAQQPINTVAIRVGHFAAATGLTRWLYDVDGNDAFSHGALSEAEKAIYRAVFYRRTLTENMVNEIGEIKANALAVAESDTPAVPYLLFVSNGAGTGFDTDQWRQLQSDFADSTPSASMTTFDVSHYLHNIEAPAIAVEMRHFLDGLPR